MLTTEFSDLKIIKEGEAEILLHAKNEAFFNKAQVNSRDISMAVLRTFISKRKLEHEEYLSRRTKTSQRTGEKGAVECVAEEPSEPPAEEEEHNGECQVPSETAQEEQSCTHDENSTKIVERNGLPELKAPRVLKALSASGLRALRYAREVEGIDQLWHSTMIKRLLSEKYKVQWFSSMC